MHTLRLRHFNMGGLTRNLLLSCVCSYIGALSFGYMIGYSSPALPQMSPPGGPLDEDSASWFSSIATIGAIFGCPLAGWLVEKTGRRTTLLVSAVPFIAGNAIVFLGSTINLLCLGRLLTGVSAGMSTVVCPMYIAELAPKELRGMLGSGVQLAITIGILLVYLLGMLCGWRTLAAIGALIPVAAIIFTIRGTETPRYYLGRGHRGEVVRVLSWLRPSGSDVEEEVRDMEESLQDKDESLSPMDLIQKSELFRPLKVSVAVMVFQQLSGINVVMFYTVSIFQSAGFKENGELATVAVGATQVVMTVAACALMDKAGRRVLLMVGGLGMSVCCGLLGYYYYSVAMGTAAGLSWLALLSLIMYIVFFSLGWGPIPMLVMSEIFPAKARGAASAVAAVTSWTTAFLVTKEYSTLQEMLGLYGTFYFFSVCCFISVIFVWKAVPETRGKSLEDIELYFIDKSPTKF